MPVISGSDSRSGYLNLPPRVQLRERDSATGSYPTMARTGDPDFSGNKPVKFDDSRTVIFSDDVTVSYPTLLQPSGQSLKFITGSLASPNSSSDILATGTVRKGIADQFAFFDNSEQLGPFKEHLRVVPNEGAFYLTGTDPNVLPGFSSRLGSKTQITIEFEVTGSTDIFFSTGTNGGTVGVNSGLAYYNWNSQGWDIIGDLSTGSNIDYFRNDDEKRANALLCFANDTFGVYGSVSNDPRTSGEPVDVCGFPTAQQFNPTFGQELFLADRLSGPFAVEKVLVEFSATFNMRTSDPTATSFAPPTNNMFLLNAFGNSGSMSFQQTRSSRNFSESPRKFYDFEVTNQSSQYKDLIWYGAINNVVTYSGLTEEFRRDLTYLSSSNGVPKNWILSGTVSATSNYQNSNFYSRRFSSDGSPVTPNFKIVPLCWPGNRNGWTRPSQNTQVGIPNNLSSGRSLVGSLQYSTLISSSLYPADNDAPDAFINTYKDYRRISPYVLFPKDSLILGFTNQITNTAAAKYPGGEGGLPNFKTTMHPGKYRLTLYGSQIRDGKEFHDTSNQPLNSDAIHEALHFDNPTVDQFQVEPLTFYSGSYIDDIVSGDFTAGTRGVVGSTAAGTQGLTGSLLRGLRVTDRRERFYDTVLPDPFNYIEGLSINSGSNFFPLSSNTTNYSETRWADNPGSVFSGSNGYLTASLLSYWWESFPFEPQFANVKRDLKGNTAQKSSNAIFGLFTTSTLDVLVRNDYTGFNLEQSTLNKFWYGFGPGYLSSSLSNPEVSSSYFRNYPRLRNVRSEIGGVLFGQDPLVLDGIDGYKYGVKNALPEFSALVTRYDRYGQFRDMLEQRPDSRFSTGETTTDAPVVVRFIDATTRRPIPASLTSSSNRSEFATSSLPYFDGIARN